MDTLQLKYENLKQYLEKMQHVIVAFSGGVDSTFLLKTAHDVLGDKVIAVTARSLSFPKRELDEADAFTVSNRIEHMIVDSEELDIEGFSQNPVNRCYLCEMELFSKIKTIAQQKNILNIIEGSNADDGGDYRPGLKAVSELVQHFVNKTVIIRRSKASFYLSNLLRFYLKNAVLGIKSPLKEAGLTKGEIRRLSKNLNLSTWDKQFFACLSSRFPYGESITPVKLKMIDRAEQFLLDLGFHQVRVRYHGNLARIETDEFGFNSMMKEQNRKKLTLCLKNWIYIYRFGHKRLSDRQHE